MQLSRSILLLVMWVCVMLALSFLQATSPVHGASLMETLRRLDSGGTEFEHVPPAVRALLQDDRVTFSRHVATAAQADQSIGAGFTYLHLATLFGPSAIFEYLLELGVALDPIDDEHQLTPLHLAAAAGRKEMLQRLIAAGATPELRTRNGASLAHCAADSGDANLMDWVINEGHAFRVSDNRGLRPLHYAARAGYTAVVRRLIDAGESTEVRTRQGDTALLLATRRGHPSVVRFLLSRDANPNASNNSGVTALHHAVATNQRDIADQLRAKGAHLDVRTSSGHEPLHYAASHGRTEMLIWLQEQGADFTAQTDQQATALHWAAMRGRAEAVLWLIEQGADLNAQQQNGWTPLANAVTENYSDVAKLLLERGADPNLATQSGLTPLARAAQRGYSNLVNLLLEHGADINAQDNQGRTPLSEAIVNRNEELALALLAVGADPNLHQHDRRPLLQMLIARGDVELAKALLAHGAEPDYAPESARTPLQTAVYYDQAELAGLLLDLGADIDAPYNTWTPLNSAVWSDSRDTVRLLLDRGADTSIAAGFNQTPLITAARKNQLVIAELLLQYGADPWTETENGLTPWHIAHQLGHTNILQVLEARVEGMPPTNLPSVRVYFEYHDPDAKKVYVAGYFNDYSETAFPMTRDEEGFWYAERDLFETWHMYKFVVDGSWILDPTHDHIREDSSGDTSVMWATNQLVELRAERPRPRLPARVPALVTYHGAADRTVYLAGEFNGWSTTSTPMTRVHPDKWQATIHVRPGEYAYKFVVDGNWIMDPENPLTTVVGNVENSLLIVDAPDEAPAPVDGSSLNGDDDPALM